MIVRSEDFEAKTHPVLLEPGLPDEFKRELKERGMADTMNGVECMEIVDDGFSCGKKLTTPYVYWQGLPHGLSLHPHCATRLALGLAQDGYQAARGQRPETERDAAKWLDLFASKKEYGLDDEEIPKP
jgi:hypothetical protein